MKKFMFRFVILLAGLVGISIVNNVIMLKIHPLEFYYTPTGLMISMIVMAIEMLVLWPTVTWYVRKFLTVAIATDEEESN